MIHVAFMSIQPTYAGEQGKTIFTLLAYLRRKHKKLVAHHRDGKTVVGQGVADGIFHRQCRAMGIPRIVWPHSRADWNGNASATDDEAQATKTTTMPPHADPMRTKMMLQMCSAIIHAGTDDPDDLTLRLFLSTLHLDPIPSVIYLVRPDGTWSDDPLQS